MQTLLDAWVRKAKIEIVHLDRSPEDNSKNISLPYSEQQSVFHSGCALRCIPLHISWRCVRTTPRPAFSDAQPRRGVASLRHDTISRLRPLSVFRACASLSVSSERRHRLCDCHFLQRRQGRIQGALQRIQGRGVEATSVEASARPVRFKMREGSFSFGGRKVRATGSLDWNTSPAITDVLASSRICKKDNSPLYPVFFFGGVLGLEPCLQWDCPPD